MAGINYHDVVRVLKADFETGKLYWLPRTPDMFTDGKYQAERVCSLWNRKLAGKEAFTANLNGYRQGEIFGRHSKAHRVLWLLYTGKWPSADIDHINGIRSDNRIENLRVVSRAENLKNQRLRTNNTSGVTGVSWDKRSGKWHAHIQVNVRRKHIGYFTKISDAIAARKAAEVEYGFHANHGSVRAADPMPSIADEVRALEGLIG